jgi:hypothetical protein
MPAARKASRATCGLIWAVAVLVSTPGGRAADPSAAKSGGLVPAPVANRSGLTREELVRSWDLDGDGTISKPEADVARGRMRRKRLEMQLDSGMDPLTGLPRSLQPIDPEADAEENDEPIFRLPPESPQEPERPEASLPGMRSPTIEVPGAMGGSSLPSAPASAAPPLSPRGSIGPQPPARSGRASWLPPQRFAPAVTGGVRAGAPAAVSGYGAGPWSDLNAGRRPTNQQSGVGNNPTGQAAANGATGGLLPANRPAGRTGSLIIPAAPGQPRGLGTPPRSAAPPPPLVPRPGISAEEIGGYRP